MRKVHGYVLARSTGVGIANLVVAAFYSELEVVALATHVRAHDVDERVWVHFGERIGSVLTDEAGHFELDARDDERQTRRLVVVVFAPEDITDPNHPVPLPAERRILYMSALPRTAGAEEAYVIRLLQAQLDRFGIGSGGPTAASSHLGDAIEEAFAFRENLATRLQPRLIAQLDAAKESRDTAKNKFAVLSAIRPENRTHPQLLTDPAKLPELLATTISRGLERLSVKAEPVTLTLTEDDLAHLGLEADADGNVTGTVDPSAVASLIKSHVGGVDLVFKPPGASAAALLTQGRK